MTNYEMTEQIGVLAKAQYGDHNYAALWGMSQALLTEKDLNTILSLLIKDNK